MVKALGPSYFRMDIESPPIAQNCRPGQFVMVRPLPDTTDPLLGRPLAIFDTRPDAGVFSLLFTVAGRGTAMLSEIKSGDTVAVNGPLGNWFNFDSFDQIAAIGGGTGFAPLHFLVLAAREKGKKAFLIVGARTDDLLPDIEMLHDKEGAFCATDDGSFGKRGTAVDAFMECVQNRLVILDKSTGCFTAGPLPMMKALHAQTSKLNLSLYVSMEARMACGIGVCRGCIIPAAKEHPEYGFMHRAVCKDGPIFKSSDIAWDKL